MTCSWIINSVKVPILDSWSGETETKQLVYAALAQRHNIIFLREATCGLSYIRRYYYLTDLMNMLCQGMYEKIFNI
jgi:hypothetical protein